ncbi:ATP-binding protein [Streptomyces sp. cmx-4-9]|uniref:ATP-binding protein n=1 Tax=Streptomyces sp. cmx-4-9 TaxID=2790941 RepID=UPI00398156F0
MNRDTYRFGVECALQRSYAGLALLFGAVWSAVALSSAASAGVRDPLTAAASAVFVLLLAVTALRGRRTALSGRQDAPAALGAALAVHAAYAVEQPQALSVGLRSMATVAAVLLAVGFLGGRAGRAVALAAIAAQVAAGVRADGVFGALEGVWPAAASALAAAALAPALRAAGLRADAAERDKRAAVAQAAQAQAARRAHREFQRLLHDDVGAALRAAARPGVPAQEQRAQARRAVAGLTAGPVGPDGAGALVDLAGRLGEGAVAGAVAAAAAAAGRGAGPRVSAELPDGPVLVPREVGEACVRAATEALSNAGRYADATRVRVRLDADASADPGDSGGGVLPGGAVGVALTVSDDGVGFTPDRVGPDSFGLRRSVHQCMGDVGGTAEVISAPGRGTTVRLRWRPAGARSRTGSGPARPRGQAATIRAAIGDVRRPLAAVCLPFLAVMACVAAVHAPRTPGMVWYLPWYGLLAAATGMLLARADRGVGGRAALGWTVFAVGGSLSSLLVMPPEGIADYTSWPIGAITPLLTLLVTVRPRREVLWALACEEAGIVVLMAARPPEGASSLQAVTTALPALAAPVMGVVMGAVIGRTVARLGGAVLDAEATRTAVAAAESAARARRAEYGRRLADLDDLVLPFLRVLASGPVGDLDEVRGRAKRLGQSLRDELHLPGVMDRPLRSLVNAARGAGCTVTVHAYAEEDDGPAAAGVRPELVRGLLTAALRDRHPPAELVLSIQYGVRRAGVSLLAVPGDPGRAAALRAVLAGERAEVEDSPDLTWAEVDVDLTATGPASTDPTGHAATGPTSHATTGHAATGTGTGTGAAESAG